MELSSSQVRSCEQLGAWEPACARRMVAAACAVGHRGSNTELTAGLQYRKSGKHDNSKRTARPAELHRPLKVSRWRLQLVIGVSRAKCTPVGALCHTLVGALCHPLVACLAHLAMAVHAQFPSQLEHLLCAASRGRGWAHVWRFRTYLKQSNFHWHVVMY